MPTPAHQTFRESMNTGRDRWHDGEPYDLSAFAQMSPEEKETVAREMLAKHQLDWRDMQVLAAVNSAKAFNKLRDLLDERQPVQVQAFALRELIGMPKRMGGSVADAKIRDLLERVTEHDGLTTVLQLAEQHGGPWSKLALLRGVRERPGLAIHFASSLLDMAGLSSDMAAFDPKFRPTLLNLLPDSTPDERAAAFAKLCGWLDIDPATIPDRDGGQDIAWAEQQWPARR